MPLLAEDRLKELTESLTEYSEDSMSAAIEAARDPDVARQLTDLLKEGVEGLSMRDFTEVGLAVALSEARVAEAAPILLRMALNELFDISVYTDAAVYALQRMGPPAFEEAMRYLEAPEEDVEEQSTAYEVLLAAADANPRLRTEVADFCYGRLEAETIAFDSGEANFAYSCCQVLVFLGDDRARPLIEREAKEDPDFEDLLDELNQNVDSTIFPRWREPWQQACSKFAARIKQYAQGFDSTAAEEEPTDLLDEPEVVARRNEFARLVEEFNATPAGQEELSKEGATPNDLNVILNLGIEGVCRDFDLTNKSHLYRFFYKLLPRELVVNGFAAGRLPKLVAAFLQFLHFTGRLQDPKPLVDLLEKASVEVPPLAEDATRWNFEKRMEIEAQVNGYDLRTGEGANDYAEFLAQRIFQREQAAKASNEGTDITPAANHTPFRRESAKVGRNDPCPCGSGKKYKKCCGK